MPVKKEKKDAKEVKAPTKKRGNYEQPLQVNGTFMDIMNAAVKHREANVKKKVDPKDDMTVSETGHQGG